jgi:hypothetical protein
MGRRDEGAANVLTGGSDPGVPDEIDDALIDLDSPPSGCAPRSPKVPRSRAGGIARAYKLIDVLCSAAGYSTRVI